MLLEIFLKWMDKYCLINLINNRCFKNYFFLNAVKNHSNGIHL